MLQEPASAEVFVDGYSGIEAGLVGHEREQQRRGAIVDLKHHEGVVAFHDNAATIAPSSKVSPISVLMGTKLTSHVTALPSAGMSPSDSQVEHCLHFIPFVCQIVVHSFELKAGHRVRMVVGVCVLLVERIYGLPRTGR